MNTAPIRPATIVHDADGTPRSAEYGDVYHPRGGALAQARHVFLDGDVLAQRWRGRERCVIVETGFGLGTNFLATWAAWRADPERCRQLHFISIEGTPPTAADLRAISRDRELAPLAAALVERWPPLIWNLHRLDFDNGSVELLLAFGDVADWLPQLVANVDAFFLDGFAPARNPAMWDVRLFKAMARLAAPGATVATWSAARTVRDGLRSAGFDVAIASGSGGKRDITRGRFAPPGTARPTLRRAGWAPSAVAPPTSDEAGPVVIIGAGLAGCALADALASRGRASLVLERNPVLADEGSGNAAGLFHATVHRVDGRHARFHRAAAFAAQAAVRDAIEAHGVRGSTSGLLRLATDAPTRTELQAVIDALGLPADHVRALDADAASRLAGVPVAAPAWHYPSGGWVDPPGLARAYLARAGARTELRLGCAVASLGRIAERWVLRDAAGASIVSAATVVLCNAGGALELLGRPPWPVGAQRGQMTSIAADALADSATPRLPLVGAGYVLPPIDGEIWFGASTDWDDADRTVRPSDQHANLARLMRLVGLSAPPASDRLGGRTGVRWSSRDRLPLIGAVPATIAAAAGLDRVAAVSSRVDQLRFIARAPGLFMCSALGSRGIASSALGAQIVAAAIVGTPAPVEADLLDAIDPARFLVRQLRRAARWAPDVVPTLVQLPVGPMTGSAGT